MYGVVRLIVGCLFLGCSLSIIKKSKIINKHVRYIVFSCISVTLIVVLAFIPFENLFVTFNSPKAAYEYYVYGKSNIALVVEGNDSDFIVDRTRDNDTHLIIPKTTKGWKIGIGSNTKKRAQFISNGIVVNVYQYQNTNDFFITVFNTDGGKSIISDEYNTVFYSLEKYNYTLGKTFFTYYAHITNLNPSYSITVNDTKIVLAKPARQGTVWVNPGDKGTVCVNPNEKESAKTRTTSPCNPSA